MLYRLEEFLLPNLRSQIQTPRFIVSSSSMSKLCFARSLIHSASYIYPLIFYLRRSFQCPYVISASLHSSSMFHMKYSFIFRSCCQCRRHDHVLSSILFKILTNSSLFLPPFNLDRRMCEYFTHPPSPSKVQLNTVLINLNIYPPSISIILGHLGTRLLYHLSYSSTHAIHLLVIIWTSFAAAVVVLLVVVGKHGVPLRRCCQRRRPGCVLMRRFVLGPKTSFPGCLRR